MKQWTHKLKCHHADTVVEGFVTNGHERGKNGAGVWHIPSTESSLRCTSQACGALITISNRFVNGSQTSFVSVSILIRNL